LVRAAQLGSPAAACLLAQRLERADPSIPPAERIVELLASCAARGHADAQAMLALLYFQGKHVQEDQGLAMHWFTRAAQRGNAFAQAWLGDILIRGQGVAVDRDAAAVWYQRAALQGHAGAIAALTSLRMADGAGGDELAQVFQLWLLAAQGGHAEAQRVVGDFYLRGVGIEPSVEEARRWLDAAVLQGYLPAMVLLAGLLLQHAPESEHPQAVELFRRAAASGNIDAQYNLGVCLRRGLGVASDDIEAEQLYSSAARQGHRSAQLALAALKAQSATTEAGWQEAAHWYRLAADAGHPAAVVSLAQLYESGRGVERDRAAALRLYRQALAAGQVDCAREVRRLEAELSGPEFAS
jgi:TPR repeat protein